MRRAIEQATLSLSVLEVQMSSVISLQLTLEVASCISFEWQHPTFITKERHLFCMRNQSHVTLSLSEQLHWSLPVVSDLSFPPSSTPTNRYFIITYFSGLLSGSCQFLSRHSLWIYRMCLLLPHSCRLASN